MKSRTLPLIAIISLILITLAFSLPGQGESLFGNPLDVLAEAKRVAAAYSNTIKLSEDTVKAIGDDMDGVRPPGEDRSPDERVKALKEGITGELAKAKANQLALKMATEQLAAALDRYNKNPTPENLKNANGLVQQINSYRDLLNGNFEIIRGMFSQISKIRRNFDEKEWDKQDGKYTDEREAIDKLWNSLKVVPDVVDMSYQRAIEVLAGVDMTVGSVVVKPAPSKDLSEKVTKQEPKAGEFIPPGKTAKLWHYDRFGVAAPPVTPPATGAQGFQKGDAGRIDPRFGALPEKISPDGNSIHLEGKSGTGWGIIKYASRTEALGKMKEIQKAFSNMESKSDSYGEAILKARIFDPEEVMAWWTTRGFYGNPPLNHTTFSHSKIYRDVFVIGYTEHSKKFDDNLPIKWPAIHENSTKLIDERFPPEPMAMDAWPGGRDRVCIAGID